MVSPISLDHPARPEVQAMRRPAPVERGLRPLSHWPAAPEALALVAPPPQAAAV
jgi:hypothetical protein